MSSLAVVAIGRNEGARLERCLVSAAKAAELVVYVDSGSTDGSVAFAQSIGTAVVALDMSQPFTAARARNEGLRKALALKPDLTFVQFVDGDCEMAPTWLAQARGFLDQHADVAAVCGRRRERFPEASVYNQLCDLEWNTPVGEAKACGGDVLMRAQAISRVDGYRENVIAGEEPELCIRLRAQGWRIWRLDADMTWHDANMTRFTQWWLRAVRCGYAYALGAHLHGAPPERHWVAERNRALLWGLALPVLCLGLGAISPWLSIGWAMYPAQIIRLARRGAPPGSSPWAHAWFSTIGKFAEVQGIGRFWKDRLMARTPRIIEYK